ncbi:MAG: hypothetical protein ACYCQI_13475 [Gammaproteobacteria bacterium]
MPPETGKSRFLRQAKALDLTRITPPALTAITLLIAESAPKEKDKMIGLVCTLLAKRKTNDSKGK